MCYSSLHVKNSLNLYIKTRAFWEHINVHGIETRYLPLHLLQLWRAQFLCGDSDLLLGQCKKLKIKLKALGRIALNSVVSAMDWYCFEVPSCLYILCFQCDRLKPVVHSLLPVRGIQRLLQLIWVVYVRASVWRRMGPRGSCWRGTWPSSATRSARSI